MKTVEFEQLVTGVSRFTLPPHSHANPDANDIYRSNEMEGDQRTQFEDLLKRNGIKIVPNRTADPASLSGLVAVKESPQYGKHKYYMRKEVLTDQLGVDGELNAPQRGGPNTRTLLVNDLRDGDG